MSRNPKELEQLYQYAQDFVNQYSTEYDTWDAEQDVIVTGILNEFFEYLQNRGMVIKSELDCPTLRKENN